MIPAQVRKVLDAHGLQALEFEVGSTPTSEMAAQRIGCEVGQIAKSMLFKGKDGAFRLIVCAGDRRVDNRKLKQALGVKARFANSVETEQVTGFKPGGVCPFGLDHIDTLIDISLQRFAIIYPAAGNDASGVALSFAQLQQITNASLCDVMS
ncbi:MAG: YbaK/EbsC family protein [Gammaproteobacteria bacterium]|nr:YbaK/EbsC family protein [Gammaproteobacteria bacterium]